MRFHKSQPWTLNPRVWSQTDVGGGTCEWHLGEQSP